MRTFTYRSTFLYVQNPFFVIKEFHPKEGAWEGVWEGAEINLTFARVMYIFLLLPSECYVVNVWTFSDKFKAYLRQET